MRKIIVKGLSGPIRALLKHIAQSPGVFLATELQTVDLELAKIIRAQSALHWINSSNLKFSRSAKTFQLSLIEFLRSALWISGHCFQFVKVGFDEQIADVDGLFATHRAWKSNFCQAQVQVQFRWGSGEGQEGQSQEKSSSENSKLKDLDLSHTLNLVFTSR